MRRPWAASAAIVLCLALGGWPALAQEAGPSGSPTPPGSTPIPPGSSMLSLTVVDLVGMVGLEVAADLVSESGGWGPHLFGQVVDQEDATVTASGVLAPGRYSLVVYAGAPPCDVRFAPMCGLDEPVPVEPEFVCGITLDLEPDEATELRIVGVPRSGPEVAPACPVSHLLHPESPARSDG